MRKLAICSAAALVLSTGLALAQGSGAAGDIGSGTIGARPAPAAQPGTVGQGMTSQTATPAPKAAKKTAKKKSAAPN
jgi:hypothetical protein